MSLFFWGGNKSEQKSSSNAVNIDESNKSYSINEKLLALPVSMQSNPHSGNDYDVIEIEYRTAIVNRLNEIGVDGESFCHEMVKHKCVMAGSFPLQCLLGEYYDDSDIDVFVNNPSSINGLMCTNVTEFDHPFSNYICNNYDCYKRADNAYMFDLVYSQKYKIKPKTVINIICVKEHNSNLFEFIENNFDLSCCQTTFDGVKLRYTQATQNKRGYITNFHKKEPNTKKDNQDYLQKRIEKYRSRGFNIISRQFNVKNKDN